jgi:hypothetical protein
MTAPAERIDSTQIAPGWCDLRFDMRLLRPWSLYATFGPKIFSTRLTNDRLFDWKVIALTARSNGTAVALRSTAQRL